MAGVSLSISTNNNIATVTTVSLTGTVGDDKIVLQDDTMGVIIQANNEDVIMRFSAAVTHGFTLPQANVATLSAGPLTMHGSFAGQTLYFSGTASGKVEVIELRG